MFVLVEFLGGQFQVGSKIPNFDGAYRRNIAVFINSSAFWDGEVKSGTYCLPSYKLNDLLQASCPYPHSCGRVPSPPVLQNSIYFFTISYK
jgi:hypothetical protein